MPNDNTFEINGTVLAARGNGMFLVRPDEGSKDLNCKLSGKIQKNNIKIIEGSYVTLQIDAYNPDGTARIIYRIK